MDKAHEVSLHHSRTCIEYYDVGASGSWPASLPRHPAHRRARPHQRRVQPWFPG